MTARRNHNCVAPAEAAATWKSLAPLMAARPTMRLWSQADGFDQVQPLTRRLPERPAAVPLYSRGRTRLLAIDLDAKKHGANAVRDDRDRILSWIRECGGAAVVDTSTSGGAHILIPLDVAATVDELRPLLTTLAARCPTLDATPMLNAVTGCITVPGSACREGGHRRLAGPLAAAQRSFEQRNGPAFLGILSLHLAALPPVPAIGHQASSSELGGDVFEGDGEHRRLHPRHQLHTQIPVVVAEFARTGAMPADRRWPSRSEARQSVLTHALWRGATLFEVRELTTPGQAWALGLGASYNRYGHHRHTALHRDWISAQRWLAASIRRFQAATHKKQHTGGAVAAPPSHRLWLAHAIWWCDTSFRSLPQRWAVAAVLQALAISAVRAGELVNGVPVVAVGGRSLSIAAGLLSESTVWAVLRMLRDTPGAPILLVAKGAGLNADRYGLTTPDLRDPYPDELGRPAVTDVHDAWSVIGLQHRRVYEAIANTGLDNAGELAAAARMSASSTYNSLAELARIGLICRRAGVITLGDTTLDDIATQHRVAEVRSSRITVHRAARMQWQTWLATRRIRPTEPAATITAAVIVPHVVLAFDAINQADYLTSVMATGPPAAWAV
jgi:hypothetical protein